MSEEVSTTREHATCPACGYDLFGLTVDQNIVRCPECGLRLDLRLLLTPPWDRARKLRGMESLPALAVGPPLGALCVLPSAIETHRVDPGNSGLFVACLILVLIGIAGTAVYLRRYRFVVGAGEVLLLFGACSVLFLVGAPMFLCGLFYLIGVPRDGISQNAILLPAISTAALALFWVLYRRARRILGTMHDQLVVRVAVSSSDAEARRPES